MRAHLVTFDNCSDEGQGGHDSVLPCLHNAIVVLLKQCRLLWLALSFRLGHATHCVSFAITHSQLDCQGCRIVWDAAIR